MYDIVSSLWAWACTTRLENVACQGQPAGRAGTTSNHERFFFGHSYQLLSMFCVQKRNLCSQRTWSTLTMRYFEEKHLQIIKIAEYPTQLRGKGEEEVEDAWLHMFAASVAYSIDTFKVRLGPAQGRITPTSILTICLWHWETKVKTWGMRVFRGPPSRRFNP